jgi:small subunit ribosomal protein S21
MDGLFHAPGASFSLLRELSLSTRNSQQTSIKCGILNSAHLGRFGGVYPLAEIRVQEGEPLENALRRFKRKVQTEDIIKEVKRHSFYLKPGEKKRVKEALARKRNRKKIRKEQD